MSEILFAFLMVAITCLVSLALDLKLARGTAIATIRTVLQLFLLGHVLSWLFHFNSQLTFWAAFLIMVLLASLTAIKRIRRKFDGIWATSYASILLSSLTTGAVTLFLIIPQKPWFNVGQAIPLMGMIIGNSLTCVSLAMNQFISDLMVHRVEMESFLSMGATRREACDLYLKKALQTGLTPIMNSMSVVGLVSIPGMMTGQILAGHQALTAAKYQMCILIMIFCCNFFSILIVLFWNFLRFFNSSHQLEGKLMRQLA